MFPANAEYTIQKYMDYFECLIFSVLSIWVYLFFTLFLLLRSIGPTDAVGVVRPRRRIRRVPGCRQPATYRTRTLAHAER